MNRVDLYARLLYPLLSRLTDANRAHDRAIDLAAWAPPLLTTLAAGQVPTSLGLRAGGVDLPNPLILAAGFDKDARCAAALHRLGFGAVVVGTVLEHPQPGNPQPTIFRPVPGVVLNRMGFPSAGLDVVRRNLTAYADRSFPLGVSVGINKGVPPGDAPRAYAAVVQGMRDYADFFEINVSSPNTPGLRDLQQRDHLVAIIEAVQSTAGGLPLWVKIAPDLTLPAVDEVIAVAEAHGVAAIVAANTTNSPAVKAALGERWAHEAGGVSGPPLHARAVEVVRHIAQHTTLDVVGCGGVRSVPTLQNMLAAGARAVGVYTGLVTHGPGLPAHLLRQLEVTHHAG